jgi:universal stress protein A
MFQFIPVREDNIFAVRVSGRVTHDEYQAFLPELEGLIKRYGKISLLIELDQFEGAELIAMKDDMKFGLSNQESFEKIAVVGEKLWERWGVALGKPFVDADMKYFDKNSSHEAWDWLRSDQLLEAALDEAEVTDYKTVLVAVDFSKNARFAAHRAKSIAKSFSAELRVLHVVNEAVINDYYYQPLGLGMMAGDASELQASMLNSGEKQMNALLEELEIPLPQGEVMMGSPVNSIVSYAQAQNVDLIVLGTRSRRGIGSLIGSTTNYVSSHAQCDVLAVPLPAKAG